MVKRSEWVKKHGLYVEHYGGVERRIALKRSVQHKDAEGQHVHVKEFLIPGVKKAEPLDAYGWITLTTRVGSFVGIIYLVVTKVAGVI